MYWRNISLKKIILPNIENQKIFYRIKKKNRRPGVNFWPVHIPLSKVLDHIRVFFSPKTLFFRTLGQFFAQNFFLHVFFSFFFYNFLSNILSHSKNYILPFWGTQSNFSST